MGKINSLLGFFQKQKPIIDTLYKGIKDIDLSVYENQFVFALKAQQLYTALEELFKSVVRTFENSIDDHTKYHIEILKVVSMDVHDIRPKLISDDSYKFLDKLRSFRHFIRHGYNYELDVDELFLLQKKLNQSFQSVIDDIESFTQFLSNLLVSDEH
jgi:hypothetical protein